MERLKKEIKSRLREIDKKIASYAISEADPNATNFIEVQRLYGAYNALMETLNLISEFIQADDDAEWKAQMEMIKFTEQEKRDFFN